MNRLNRAGFNVLMGVLAALILLPALLLVIEGVRHWRHIAPVPVLHFGAVSVSASLLALLIILVAGTPLAWWLARLPSVWQRWSELALSVPLLLPPLVIGLVLAYLVGPERFPRLAWTNTWSGLVTAETYEAAPYYVFAAWAAFRSVPEPLYDAARTFMTPVRTLLAVVVPLASPGLAVGAAMAWARAIGAFGAPIVVSYHPMGLPVGIWLTLEEYGLPQALPVALLLVVIALPLPLLAMAWSRGTVHHAER